MLIGQVITHRRDPGESHSLKTVVFPGAKRPDLIYDKPVARKQRNGSRIGPGTTERPRASAILALSPHDAGIMGSSNWSLCNLKPRHQKGIG